MMKLIKRFSALIVVAMMTVAVVMFAACDAIEITHTYSDEWQSDARGHWHPSICHEGFRTEKIPHTLNEDDICTVCGWGRAPVIPDDPVVSNPDDDTPDISGKEKIKVYFMAPVNYTGISMEYTSGPDNPFVFNPTLEVWAAHRAVDLLAPAGTDVVAMFEGTVVKVGDSYNLGSYVVIDHGNNVVVTYASLQNVQVTENQKVAKGDKIGESSISASAEFMDGAHVHLEIKVNSEYVDPMPYVNGEIYREMYV